MAGQGASEPPIPIFFNRGNQIRYVPPMPSNNPLPLSTARRIWLHAQRLTTQAPFGDGPDAVAKAVDHLGYVQIDTINVIERCHHHILWTRIPDYSRKHLHQAQTTDKTVFEYWTHALSYIPSKDIPYFLPAMKRHRLSPSTWYSTVKPEDLRRVINLIRNDGALSIRDIDDEVLVEKEHAWASRKPSKRALQLAFYTGALTISARAGMVKTYELMDRHFGWDARPKPATEPQVLTYLLDRALRSQGLVSLDSICHLDAPRKAAIRQLIETRVRRKQLVPASIEGAEKLEHWTQPSVLEPQSGPDMVHLLSPFDPLIIQRKRLQLFFGYGHRFEAYVPKEKRLLGYFALPVLVGDEIVAAIDLKADRENQKLLVQKWTWVGHGAPRSHKVPIEQALDRFSGFQFDVTPAGSADKTVPLCHETTPPSPPPSIRPPGV
jgi:uncharacterized protein YcaQ